MNFEKKCLFSGLVLSMLFGYAFAVLQIAATSGFTPQNIVEHFQGNEAEMIFGMDYSRLVKLSHIHMLGMPMILTPAAWIFTLTPFFTERTRGMIIVAGYAGIGLDILSWWGLTYIGGGALPALIGGGLLLAFSMVTMSLLDLKWLWSTSHQTAKIAKI